MATSKARREELARQRAEIAAQMRAVRRSVRRAGKRIDWTNPANRRYNPLAGQTTADLKRLNGRQLAAVKRRLDEWNPRRLKTAASGEIIDPAKIAEMRRARKRAYDRAYRAARRVNASGGGPTVTARQILDMQGGPVRPRSTRNIASAEAYDKMLTATRRQAAAGPASRQRRQLDEMLRGVPLPADLRRRLDRLSDAGVMWFRNSAPAMNAVKELYLGATEDFGALEAALDRAEGI